MVLVTHHWGSPNKPSAVQVDQLSSYNVDLPAASAASNASLIAPAEITQLSQENPQDRPAAVPSAGFDHTTPTISDNSLSASFEGLPTAMPALPADLPLKLLETEQGVVKPPAEEASGEEAPLQDR